MELCEQKQTKTKNLDHFRDDELIEYIESESLTVKYFNRNYGIVFPSAEDIGVDLFQCSRYARKIANLDRLFLNPANAWELADKNLSEDYTFSKLKKSCVVIFYNPKSLFNQEDRSGTHVGYCLGRDKENNFYFIQQLKIKTKILSLIQMEERGLIPKKIIFPEEF